MAVLCAPTVWFSTKKWCWGCAELNKIIIYKILGWKNSGSGEKIPSLVCKDLFTQDSWKFKIINLAFFCWYVPDISPKCLNVKTEENGETEKQRYFFKVGVSRWKIDTKNMGGTVWKIGEMALMH